MTSKALFRPTLVRLTESRLKARLPDRSAEVSTERSRETPPSIITTRTTSTTASTDPRLRDGCGSEKGCVRNRMGTPGDYLGVDFMLRSGITQSNTW
jgi:hypothetical protein